LKSKLNPVVSLVSARISCKSAIRAPRGLCLNVGIDGSSELGNTHVLSWFIPHNFDTRLAVTFAPSVNEFHFHKATDVAYDFKELLAIVALRLNSAANGSAFQD